MASPEEVVYLLPDILPEDFSEWDGEASAPLQSGRTNGPQPVHSATQNAKTLTPETGAGVAPGVGRPRSVHSARSGAIAPGPTEVPDPFAEHVSRSVSYRLEPSHHWSEPQKQGLSNPAEAQARTSARSAVETLPMPVAVETEVAERAGRASAVAAQQAEPRAAAVQFPAVPGRSRTVNAQPKAPEAKGGSMSDAAIVDLFRDSVEIVEEDNPGKKKQIVMAGVGAGVLLLMLLSIPFFHHGSDAAATHSATAAVQPAPAAIRNRTGAAKPLAGRAERSHRAESKAASPAAGETASVDAANADQATSGQQADPSDQTTATPQQPNVQSAMMQEQLAAPARISQKVANTPVGSAPPPVNVGSLGVSSTNADGGVFSAPAQPIVKGAPAKPIAIAANVANSMLIHKRAPVYPLIAKNAGISGTVTLEALISKAGTIKSLKVASGPVMLRQAAIDAVQTWRYKPYLLNNQPTEMETTISIVFTQGG